MGKFTLLLGVLLITGILYSQERDYTYKYIKSDQEISFKRAPGIKSKISDFTQVQPIFVPESFNRSSKGAYLFEGFEGLSFPPPGWVKYNPDFGNGWERQSAGTSPVPGWTYGTITSAPFGGGKGVAFCTWTTGGNTFNDQWLVTPQYKDVQTGDSLRFWMYKFADYVDSLDVKISTTGNLIGDFTSDIAQIGYSSADTGWTYYSYSLDSYSGSDIYIAFNEHVADNFTNGDALFLDNVTIGSPPANDVGAITIDIPKMIQQGSFNPTATVMNFGTVAQSFNVQMVISGGYYSSITVTGLAPNTSQTVTFDPWNPNLGNYSIDVCTQLSGDFDSTNNCKNRSIQVIEIPNKKVYCYISGDPSGFLPDGPAYFFLQDPSTIYSLADQSGDEPVYGASWGPGNKWYGIAGFQLLNIDTITGFRNVIGNATPESPAKENWTGISFDYSNNILYGFTYNGSASILYVIDHNTGSATLIGSTPDKLIINLACNLSGELYGVDIIANELCSINKTSGFATAIGAIGFNANYAQTMEFDRENELCYYLSYNDFVGGQLRVVDVITGETSVLGALLGGSEVTGFAIPFNGSVNLNEMVEEEAFFHIYPNPAKTYLVINSHTIINRCKLINHLGQSIMDITTKDKNITINTFDIRAGIYLLQMETEVGIETRIVIFE
jgi:hypothetical protein